VIFPNGGLVAELRHGESRTQFRDKLLHRVAFTAKPRSAKIPVQAFLGLGPMRLMPKSA